MNAVEFVRKYGLDKAKREISYEGTMMQCNNMDGIIDDLKQIVNAFELVEKFGGLIEAKKLHYDEFRSDINWNNLQKAINLVEQCQ